MRDFKPKNPEIPAMKCYKYISDKHFWDTFPKNYNEVGKSNIDPVSLKRLIDTYGTKDEKRTKLVIDRLTNGAEIGCVGNARNPTVQQNNKEALTYGRQVTDSVASWIKDGYVMGPVDEENVPATAKINGILTRVKPNGAVRVILNLSGPKGFSVNDGIDSDLFPATMSSTEAWLSIINNQGRNCWISKTDWADAYKHIAVVPADTQLQWFQWAGKYFKELCLVFGGASSAGIYDATAKSILELVCRMAEFPISLTAQHLDDICAASRCRTQLQRLDDTFTEVSRMTGFKLAPKDDPEKAFGPSKQGVVFGVGYDTESWTWHIPEQKLAGLVAVIRRASESGQVTAKEAKSIAGKLIHVKALVPAGRFNINHVMRLAADANRAESERQTLPVPDECRKQLWFWRNLLIACTGHVNIPIWPPKPNAAAMDAYTDAAGGSTERVGLGTGGMLEDQWFYVPWPKTVAAGACRVDGIKVGRKLAALELIGPLCIVASAVHMYRGRDLRIWVDNAGSVAIWRKGYSNSCRLSAMLVAAIHCVATSVGTRVFIEKITRRATWQACVADDLSKANFTEFRNSAASQGIAMATEPLRVPPSLVRWIADPQVDEQLAVRILRDIARTNGVNGFS